MSGSGLACDPEAPLLPDDHECGHTHMSHRAPWLRALVLGANDGLVSVSSLMMGVSAANIDPVTLLLTGTSGLVAGAMSMAVGEYISVSSQRDTEQADIAKEVEEHNKGPEAQQRELEELIAIFQDRGISRELAEQVAAQLTEQDPIRAHAREELGIDVDELARPLQASVVSMLSFTSGAALPLLAAVAADLCNVPPLWLKLCIVAATTVGLVLFGALGASLGGASMARGAARVVVGGWLAMAISFGIGHLFGVGAEP